MKKLIFLLLTISVLVSCRKKQLVRYNFYDNDLVAYYAMDGNAKDNSKFTNHGKTDATPTFNKKDEDGKAMSFESNFFQSSNIPINLSKKYTFSFWIKMKSYEDGMAIMELAKPDSTSNNNIETIPCNLNPQIWQYDGSMYLTTASNIDNQIYIMSLDYLANPKMGDPPPSWKHVLWTVSNDTTSLYVNGILKETKVMPWPDVENVNLTLGNAGNTCPGDMGVSNYHNQPSRVYIDEVKIYRRVLTLFEIQDLSK